MSAFPEPAGSGLNCPSEGGFTLIEVVLSLALTAMLLSLLSTGMYAVMNDWENDTAALPPGGTRRRAVSCRLPAAAPHRHVPGRT